jgi:hypothetical protein
MLGLFGYLLEPAKPIWSILRILPPLLVSSQNLTCQSKIGFAPTTFNGGARCQKDLASSAIIVENTK